MNISSTGTIFFKTDQTTHFRSRARGLSLTLFRFSDGRNLWVKEFHNEKTKWVFVRNDREESITQNFEFHLEMLEMGFQNVDEYCKFLFGEKYE